MELGDRRLTFGCPGANPRGALAQAGLVDEDDQPALSLGFFERRPGLALPGLHGILVALDRATLGLLHRKPQAAQDAPDLRLAELDAVQPLDEYAHSLERPQFGAEAMLGGFVKQRPSQRLQLLGIQAGRAASRGHGARRVDAALVE